MCVGMIESGEYSNCEVMTKVANELWEEGRWLIMEGQTRTNEKGTK